MDNDQHFEAWVRAQAEQFQPAVRPQIKKRLMRHARRDYFWNTFKGKVVVISSVLVGVLVGSTGMFVYLEHHEAGSSSLNHRESRSALNEAIVNDTKSVLHPVDSDQIRSITLNRWDSKTESAVTYEYDAFRPDKEQNNQEYSKTSRGKHVLQPEISQNRTTVKYQESITFQEAEKSLFYETPMGEDSIKINNEGGQVFTTVELPMDLLYLFNDELIHSDVTENEKQENSEKQESHLDDLTTSDTEEKALTEQEEHLSSQEEFSFPRQQIVKSYAGMDLGSWSFNKNVSGQKPLTFSQVGIKFMIAKDRIVLRSGVKYRTQDENDFVIMRTYKTISKYPDWTTSEEVFQNSVSKSIAIPLLISYNLLKSKHFFGPELGADFNFIHSSKSRIQNARLLFPEELNTRSFFLNFSLGMKYMVPMGKRFYLSHSVSYQFFPMGIFLNQTSGVQLKGWSSEMGLVYRLN